MKQKKKKKRKINRLEIILLFLLGICFIYTVAPNYQKMEHNAFSILYYNEDKTEQLKQEVKIKEKEVYLALEDIQNLFGQEIYIDETNEWIVTTSETKVAAIHINQPLMEINSVEIQMESSIIYEENTYYIPVSVLDYIYNIETEYIEETKTLVIDLKNKELVRANVNEKTKVKQRKKIFCTAIETIAKGESIIWISNEENGWAKIRTQKGNIGYIKQKNLTNFYTIRENMDLETSLEEQGEIEVTNIKELNKIRSLKLENIQQYKVREEMIEKIVDQCVLQSVSCLEFQDEALQQQDQTSYNRFRKELEVRLKEVGIELK